MSRKLPTITFFRHHLPHWEVEGGIYFVTINLEGAIPKNAMKTIQLYTEKLDRYCAEKWLNMQRKVFREMEKWLHREEGNRFLFDHHVARAVVESIQYRQDKGVWLVHEYVIMPNHVHLFFSLGAGIRLENTLIDFKKWTGREANRILDRCGKTFWHREWYDHWSRSEKEDDRIKSYIRNNPVKAGLVSEFQAWPFGSWSKPN